jgi:hypothetical protein
LEQASAFVAVVELAIKTMVASPTVWRVERCVIGLPDRIWAAGLAAVNQLDVNLKVESGSERQK